MSKWTWACVWLLALFALVFGCSHAFRKRLVQQNKTRSECIVFVQIFCATPWGWCIVAVRQCLTRLHTKHSTDEIASKIKKVYKALPCIHACMRLYMGDVVKNERTVKSQKLAVLNLSLVALVPVTVEEGPVMVLLNRHTFSPVSVVPNMKTTQSALSKQWFMHCPRVVAAG